MSEIFYQHIPVLLHKAVASLITNPNGIYVDATFGRGSHSQAILNQLSEQGRLIALDRDPEAIRFAKQHVTDPRFSIFHQSFDHLHQVFAQCEVLGKVSGILFDLGVSSPQLDDPARGFSFMREGVLDMRMDTSQGKTAQEWLATVKEDKLADVLWEYGEERYARRIAHAIVLARQDKPITSTIKLAEIIKFAIPKPKKPQDKHPATRSFQAIRIAINQELTTLALALNQALDALLVGGRLAVISFHSLEDRIVKQFIRHQEKGQPLPRGLPIKGDHFQAKLTALGKPIVPEQKEIEQNPRARSAILRVAEKLS